MRRSLVDQTKSIMSDLLAMRSNLIDYNRTTQRMSEGPKSNTCADPWIARATSAKSWVKMILCQSTPYPGYMPDPACPASLPPE